MCTWVETVSKIGFFFIFFIFGWELFFYFLLSIVHWNSEKRPMRASYTIFNGSIKTRFFCDSAEVQAFVRNPNFVGNHNCVGNSMEITICLEILLKSAGNLNL
jgi:hypothetical protein